MAASFFYFGILLLVVLYAWRTRLFLRRGSPPAARNRLQELLIELKPVYDEATMG